MGNARGEADLEMVSSEDVELEVPVGPQEGFDEWLHEDVHLGLDTACVLDIAYVQLMVMQI